MTTTHRIGTTAGLVLSLAAVAVPGVSARPIGADPASVTSPRAAAGYSLQDKSIVPATSTSVPTTANVSGPSPVVRLQAPANGFDWGDAGIGAAGGIALSMIGLGGALAVSQRRTRHTPA
jgi:hypothetical protein